jgi:hypothetical protein
MWYLRSVWAIATDETEDTRGFGAAIPDAATLAMIRCDQPTSLQARTYVCMCTHVTRGQCGSPNECYACTARIRQLGSLPLASCKVAPTWPVMAHYYGRVILQPSCF